MRGGDGSESSVCSLDLRPIGTEERTSTAWEMAALWMSLVVSVPSYYVAGSLVEKGMSWWQGIAVVVAGHAVLLVPLLLTSHPGTRYGIPFPVLARASFGVRGAHVAALARTLVACGWFGIETWMGGQAVRVLLPSALDEWSLSRTVPWLATSPLELLCFAAFWLLQMAAVLKGMRGIRELEKYSAPILVALVSLLLGWAYAKAGGFGPIFSQPSRLSPSEFWTLFVPSMTASTGLWAGLAVSIPDFARYARSQRDQVMGQLGMPLFMGCFAFVGLAVTSSTVVIFGKPISNPIDLLAAIGGKFTLLLAVPGICLAILTTNVPANVVSPANALVSLSPSAFSFRRGALATALVGAIAFQPWRILKSPDSFIYTWLIGCPAVLGPVSGIMLTDYYVIRRMALEVDDLYTASPGGAYYYSGGYNLAAMASLGLSLLPVAPGFMRKVRMLDSVPEIFEFIYNIGWFFGFFVGGILYALSSCCVNTRSSGGGDGGGDVKMNSKGDADLAPSLSAPLILAVEY